MSAVPRAGRYELVVFDCDGVLVDSERLAIRVEAELLTELGWSLTEEEVAARFVGRSDDDMREEVERELGRPVEWSRFEARYRRAYDQELRCVEGVDAAVRELEARGVAICVASSGAHDAIAFKLKRTGLDGPFAGRVFSAQDVARGKPAPDVFLHAAASLGVAPDGCAVVEDSAPGVAAGLAAGMDVYAFAGGVTPATRLRAGGATVFGAMSELLGLLDATASGA